jgi:hypothetical protein
VNLTVGQKVIVFDGIGGRIKRHDGAVAKVGRKLVTIKWPLFIANPYETQFRIEEGKENDGYGHRWFKTLEQAEADDRLHEARKTLNDAGLLIDYRCKLTNPQLEELAGIVKQMLSEKPADYESEIGSPRS